MRYTLLTVSSLLSAIHALTITSPTAGSTIDPSQPIVIRWESSSSDPATINLFVIGSSNSVAGSTQVATNVETSSGAYTVLPNTVVAYGAGFTVTATSPAGDNLATSGSFLLGYASDQVVTLSNGQLSLATAPSSSLTSIIFDTSGITGSMTATYFPGTSVSYTGGSTSGSLSSLSFATESVTGSMTIQPSSASPSRVTSASSASPASTSARSSTSSSASAVATANAQTRVNAGKEIMSVAGLLAGLVALVA